HPFLDLSIAHEPQRVENDLFARRWLQGRQRGLLQSPQEHDVRKQRHTEADREARQRTFDQCRLLYLALRQHTQMLAPTCSSTRAGLSFSVLSGRGPSARAHCRDPKKGPKRAV